MDTKTWLVDDLLLKADKMTMASSVELRVPFLDHRIVEFAMSIPSKFKIRKREGKYILKSIAKEILPIEIVSRKKMGFPVPTREWFGSDNIEMIEDNLFSPRSLVRDYFSEGTMKELLKSHVAGVEDSSKIIFSLLVLNAWGNMYLRKNYMCKD